MTKWLLGLNIVLTLLLLWQVMQLRESAVAESVNRSIGAHLQSCNDLAVAAERARHPNREPDVSVVDVSLYTKNLVACLSDRLQHR